METSVTEALRDLSKNIEILAAQRDEAKTALEKALEEVADLKRELEQTRNELHQKTLDVEFLSVSHKLADSPQTLADARATVRRMLSRVDKAISLLRDDARI